MTSIFNWQDFLSSLYEGADDLQPIGSEAYWRSVVRHDPYAMKVLDTIFKKQQGRGSARQRAILARAKGGSVTSWSTKN